MRRRKSKARANIFLITVLVFFPAGVGEIGGNKVISALIDVSVEAAYDERRGNLFGTYKALVKKFGDR